MSIHVYIQVTGRIETLNEEAKAEKSKLTDERNEARIKLVTRFVQLKGVGLHMLYTTACMYIQCRSPLA